MEKYFHAFVWLVITGSLVKGNSIAARKEFSTTCGDWVPYKDETCLKIAVTAGVKSQEEAEIICNSFAEELGLEFRPTLVTVPTKEKQEFVQNLLFVEEKQVDSVWLGLKETGENTQIFKWSDGSNVVYSNWAKQNVSDNHHQCVEIKSGEDGFAVGLWVRVNCMKRNIVVCERSQASSLGRLQAMFLEYQHQQERLQKETANELTLLKQKLAISEQNFANLKEQSDAIVKNVTSLSQNNLLAEKATADLKQKAKATDKTVATMKQKTETNEKSITEFRQKSEAADINIAALKQNNDALEKNVNALTQRNAAAEKNIGALTQKNQAAQNEINNLKLNPVPVGFIYVEIPGQKPPTTLWPQTKWADVSAKYAGLFFRVLGGGSSPFGQIQEGANPRLEQVAQAQGNLQSQESNPLTIPGDGSWSRYQWTGASKGTGVWMRLHLSKTEVRPRNQAIRIWQRI